MAPCMANLSETVIVSCSSWIMLRPCGQVSYLLTKVLGLGFLQRREIYLMGSHSLWYRHQGSLIQCLLSRRKEKTNRAAVSAEEHLNPWADLRNNQSSPPRGGLQEPGCGFWLTSSTLKCLDWAAITFQQHSHRGAEWGPRCICQALFHTQLSSQSYCHEMLDFLGSSILVTQPSNLFLEGVSRCPWQHFSWQRCSIALREHLVVLWLITWKRWLFLLLYLFLALGMAWMRQRKTLAPLNWLSSIKLSACW